MILDSFFKESATTNGVTVRVITDFLDDQSVPAQKRWFWSYHIRIENHRDDAVKLLTRHWKITDGTGKISHLDGDGVEQALNGRIGADDALDQLAQFRLGRAPDDEAADAPGDEQRHQHQHHQLHRQSHLHRWRQCQDVCV